MTIDAQLGLALLTAIVAVVGWLVRLQERIKRAEERHNDLKDAFKEFRGGPMHITRLPGYERERDHGTD